MENMLQGDIYRKSKQEEYYVIDRKGITRITHYPSEKTCLRQNWEIGARGSEWEKRIVQFFASFPKAKLVYDDKGKLCGLASDTHYKATFDVGDQVVFSCTDESGRVTCSRRKTYSNLFF